jgi:hypothetical protein
MSEDPHRPTAAPAPAHQPPAPPGDLPLADGQAPRTSPPAGPGGAGPSGPLDPAPLDAPAPGGAGPADPSAADANRRSFYDQFFSTDELGLIAAVAANPTPEDELWLQRVVNRRLLANVPGETSPARAAQENPPPSAPGEGQSADDDSGAEAAEGKAAAVDGLVKLAHQLNAGAGRVAALLREVRALGPEGWETPAQAARAAALAGTPARRWGGRA